MMKFAQEIIYYIWFDILPEQNVNRLWRHEIQIYIDDVDSAERVAMSLTVVAEEEETEIGLNPER